MLGIIVVALAVAFPSIAANFTGQVKVLVDKIIQTTKAVSYDGQFYAIFTGVFGFAVYALVDLLVGDGWQ